MKRSRELLTGTQQNPSRVSVRSIRVFVALIFCLCFGGPVTIHAQDDDRRIQEALLDAKKLAYGDWGAANVPMQIVELKRFLESLEGLQVRFFKEKDALKTLVSHLESIRNIPAVANSKLRKPLGAVHTKFQVASNFLESTDGNGKLMVVEGNDQAPKAIDHVDVAKAASESYTQTIAAIANFDARRSSGGSSQVASKAKTIAGQKTFDDAAGKSSESIESNADNDPARYDDGFLDGDDGGGIDFGDIEGADEDPEEGQYCPAPFVPSYAMSFPNGFRSSGVEVHFQGSESNIARTEVISATVAIIPNAKAKNRLNDVEGICKDLEKSISRQQKARPPQETEPTDGFGTIYVRGEIQNSNDPLYGSKWWQLWERDSLNQRGPVREVGKEGDFAIQCYRTCIECVASGKPLYASIKPLKSYEIELETERYGTQDYLSSKFTVTYYGEPVTGLKEPYLYAEGALAHEAIVAVFIQEGGAMSNDPGFYSRPVNFRVLDHGGITLGPGGLPGGKGAVSLLHLRRGVPSQLTIETDQRANNGSTFTFEFFELGKVIDLAESGGPEISLLKRKYWAGLYQEEDQDFDLGRSKTLQDLEAILKEVGVPNYYNMGEKMPPGWSFVFLNRFNAGSPQVRVGLPVINPYYQGGGAFSSATPIPADLGTRTGVIPADLADTIAARVVKLTSNKGMEPFRDKDEYGGDVTVYPSLGIRRSYTGWYGGTYISMNGPEFLLGSANPSGLRETVYVQSFSSGHDYIPPGYTATIPATEGMFCKDVDAIQMSYEPYPEITNADGKYYNKIWHSWCVPVQVKQQNFAVYREDLGDQELDLNNLGDMPLREMEASQELTVYYVQDCPAMALSKGQIPGPLRIVPTNHNSRYTFGEGTLAFDRASCMWSGTIQGTYPSDDGSFTEWRASASLTTNTPSETEQNYSFQGRGYMHFCWHDAAGVKKCSYEWYGDFSATYTVSGSALRETEPPSLADVLEREYQPSSYFDFNIEVE